MKTNSLLAAMFLAGQVFLLHAQTTPQIVWATNAHDYIRSVAFSADSMRLASGAQDTTAKVWSVNSHALLGTFSRNQASVTSVALSSDGTILLTGGDDGAARLWSVTSGVLLCGGFASEDIIWAVDLSPDGGLLALGGLDRNIAVSPADCSPGGNYLEGYSRDVNSLTFSPDGSKLAAASDSGVASIWRVSDGQTLQVLTGHSFFSPTNEDETVIRTVWGVDFSPDGTLLATIGDDGTTQLWRVSDGERVGILPSGSGYFSAVKFSANGKWLYTLVNGLIKFWRVSDGQLLDTFDGVLANCLTVASDGKHFAYGGYGGTLVLAYTPTVITNITHKHFHTMLQWEGGSGSYQVERRRLGSDAKWHKVGRPTLATAACVMGRPVFEYRVVSLPPQPPRLR